MQTCQIMHRYFFTSTSQRKIISHKGVFHVRPCPSLFQIGFHDFRPISHLQVDMMYGWKLPEKWRDQHWYILYKINHKIYFHDIYKGDHSGLWIPEFCLVPPGPAAVCVRQPWWFHQDLGCRGRRLGCWSGCGSEKPSGKYTINDGKSSILVGKLT